MHDLHYVSQQIHDKLAIQTCTALVRMTNISCQLPCLELIGYSFVKTRGTLLTSRTTIRVVFTHRLELCLVFDVLKGMSTETHC